MEDEENIQDLKNRIIARDNIIELYRKKYNDPFIESEIQKMKANENQFLLLKDSINANKDNINKIYKEQIEQALKQHCDKKFSEINDKLNELLNKKIEFFIQKHEKQGVNFFAPGQDNNKVKDLQDFILNLKKEIDNKVINFNQIEPISNNISKQSSIIQNSFYNKHDTDSINDSYIEEVSYECLNKSQLSLDIYEGTERREIYVVLKNNGKRIWLDGRTKLSFERESKINGDDIILGPQKPGEVGKYKIILKGLESSPPGQYHSYLGFYVGDNEVGEQLNITINVKKKITNNIHYL